MTGPRPVYVHLTPAMLPPGLLVGGIAIVVDILRTTTTILHALCAGAAAITPVASEQVAREYCRTNGSKAKLAGECQGRPIRGFDFGNSPAEFTPEACKGANIVLATTNGSNAILSAADAGRTLIGAFVNFSAVCEQIDDGDEPVHIICAGSNNRPCLEDTLFAGAMVDHLCETSDVTLDDSARLAWDCFENNGRLLAGALDICESGEHLASLGYAADVKLAGQVDKLTVAAELCRDPLRIELCAATIKRQHWTITTK
jgi:2-phosphosulfolactate phosphatase